MYDVYTHIFTIYRCYLFILYCLPIYITHTQCNVHVYLVDPALHEQRDGGNIIEFIHRTFVVVSLLIYNIWPVDGWMIKSLDKILANYCNRHFCWPWSCLELPVTQSIHEFGMHSSYHSIIYNSFTHTWMYFLFKFFLYSVL